MIVTCNGCFDKLHMGHLFFLGYCLAQGDELIVGINSDAYICQHKRNPPFRNETQRTQDLMDLGFIKQVMVFKEDTPINFIKTIKPDVHCNGEEYNNSNCVERSICAQLNTKLIFIPRIGNWATRNYANHTIFD